MPRLLPAAAFLFAAAPAGATDWRFLYTGDGEASATFVDLDSIAPRDSAMRHVATYAVERDDAPDGTAATLIELDVDCDRRRMKIVRLVRYDERGAQLEDFRGTRPWIGGFEADTQGAAMIAYICSNGASDPAVESWGAELPFEEVRRQLRARRG
jgi:hypothetical protein